MYAVAFDTGEERIQYHFPSLEQAQGALKKVTGYYNIDILKVRLKALCGGDYYSPLEESARNWESWSKGIHSSQSGSSTSS